MKNLSKTIPLIFLFSLASLNAMLQQRNQDSNPKIENAKKKQENRPIEINPELYEKISKETREQCTLFNLFCRLPTLAFLSVVCCIFEDEEPEKQT